MAPKNKFQSWIKKYLFDKQIDKKDQTNGQNIAGLL